MVEVTELLRVALDADLLAAKAWAGLSMSKRKGHALSVASATTEETRQRRLASVLDVLGA